MESCAGYRISIEALRFLRLVTASLVACSAAASAADSPPAVKPGYSFYGDPGVPDISGIWFPTTTVAPGERPQTQTDDRDLTQWFPWPPPLTPPFQKIADARHASQKLGKVIGDNGAKCLPLGMPQALTLGVIPVEVIQTPGQVSVRGVTIWTDGRPHPKSLEPRLKGHSIGYWEGDTLYVDTVGIDASTPVDSGPQTPHSGKLHMKWTVQRVAKDVMHVHFILYDEDAFTEPMVTTDIYRLKSGPEWELQDDGSCFNNNRNAPDAAGISGFKKF